MGSPGRTGVISRVTELPGDRRDDYQLVVTNDQSYPVLFEASFRNESARFRARNVRLARRDGRPLWAVTIPANGSATLRYHWPSDED